MDLITYALLKRQIAECEANIEAIIPYIGENGNWYVGDEDTGKPSRGDKGDTPQKGTDYWTAADQQAIVNDVLVALPTWEGGSY